MKRRRHHNNEGRRQVKRGKTRLQVKAIAKRLRLPYKVSDSDYLSSRLQRASEEFLK